MASRGDTLPTAWMRRNSKSVKDLTNIISFVSFARSAGYELMKRQSVTVEVTGGIAEVTHKSDYVDVNITDHDNLKAEEEAKKSAPKDEEWKD